MAPAPPERCAHFDVTPRLLRRASARTAARLPPHRLEAERSRAADSLCYAMRKSSATAATHPSLVCPVRTYACQRMSVSIPAGACALAAEVQVCHAYARAHGCLHSPKIGSDSGFAQIRPDGAMELRARRPDSAPRQPACCDRRLVSWSCDMLHTCFSGTAQELGRWPRWHLPG